MKTLRKPPRVLPSLRLSSGERREEILKSVRRVFAEHGFHGTTTRELAAAAGVSEALLFKYFPNKEAIYKAMLASCKRSPTGEAMERILQLTPSTSTLVLLLHHLFTKVRMDNPEMADTARLLVRSLGEDGKFGRVLLDNFGSTWIPKIRQCLAAAQKRGELNAPVVLPELDGWFAHHLLLALLLVQMPQEPIVNYKVSKSTLQQHAVLFVLRGMGFREDAIREHYNPEALALLAGE
ncbi:MAG TPA: helix-turn-helix domain-containing protein [Planctomycetota bacterium]|nr:helix-turn-helix domain-containing protein [Planctomycetota bacterium]